MRSSHLFLVRLAIAALFVLVVGACGGGDSEGSGDGGGDGTGQVVADQDTDDDDGGEELTIDDIDGGEELVQDDGAETDAQGEGDAVGEADGEGEAEAGDDELSLDELQENESGGDDGEDRVEVAQEDEDPVDSLLNSLTTFNKCVSDEGFDIEALGLPNQDASNADEFAPEYVAALGKCFTSSGMSEAFAALGEQDANLTPEDIAERNFGLPVFTECMERQGWDMGELEPDERGLLSNSEITPPEGESFFGGGTDVLNQCRKDAEQHVLDNYDPDA